MNPEQQQYPGLGANIYPARDRDGSNVVAQSASIAKFAAALVKAQQAARSVEKDSSNSFHRYKYASAEAIIDEARGALVSAGIACLSTGWTFVATAATDRSPPVVSKDGKPSPVAVGRVFVQYRVLHESGEWMQFEASTPVIPESGRPEDKAEATALTYNAGYFLRGLLMLPRVEEGSQVDERDDRHHVRQMPVQHENHQGPAVVAANASRAEEIAAYEADLQRVAGEGTQAGLSAIARKISTAWFVGEDAARLLEACKAASESLRHRITSSQAAQEVFK